MSNNFITDQDMEIVKRFLKNSEHRYLFSLRETGSASVRRLEQGCGAKPHDILEKSIKWRKGSTVDDVAYWQALRNAIGGNAPADKKELKALLEGLIPCRDAAGEFQGLYMTKLGEKRVQGEELGRLLVQPAGQNDENKYKYFNLRSASDRAVRLVREHPEYFFTGDYDLLDLMFSEGGGWQHVTDVNITGTQLNAYFHGLTLDTNGNRLNALSGATGERQYLRFVDQINKVLLDGNECRKILKGFDETDQVKALHFRDYKRIQHGPQDKYIEHMKRHEPEVPISKSVAGFAWPLLLISSRFSGADPQIDVVAKGVKNWNDAYSQYETFLDKKLGTHTKAIWRNETEFSRWFDELATVQKPCAK